MADASLREIGRVLLVAGAVVAALGALLLLCDTIPWIGRLPGDIVVRRRNWTLYAPIVTSVLLSLILTLLVRLLTRR
jgi:hypothetical protein